MALLSDGNENLAPFWKSVSGAVDAANHPIAIDTIALGANADPVLMSEISTYTRCMYRAAASDYCPQLASFSLLRPLAPAPGFSLANELADVYKGIAEKARFEDRIGDWSGQLDNENYFNYRTMVAESGLPEMIIALNWDSEESPLELYAEVNSSDINTLSGVEVTQDATHIQYRLQSPDPGTYEFWIYLPYYTYEDELTPYRLMASARSRTNVMAVPDSIRPVYTPGTYPVPFAWRNECSGNSGTGEFTHDWDDELLSSINDDCATLIHLQGSSAGTINLQYWASETSRIPPPTTHR